MPRKLSWSYEALAELAELLRRRDDQVGVQNCISSHATLVAEELNMATAAPGPSHFRTYVFSCMDGDVTIYVRLIFDAEVDSEVSVLSCRTVEF